MTDEPEKTPRMRLAELVQRRRFELGMDKVEVARAAGITITTYGKVETGDSVRDTTYGKLEPVLGWAAGSCTEILQGKHPITIEALGEGLQVSRIHPADLEDEVRTVIQNAAIATTELAAPEIRQLTAHILSDLKRRGILPHQ